MTRVPVTEAATTPPTCGRLRVAQDVSALLCVPVATLRQWRYLGTDPAASRVAKHLRYDPGVVLRWLVDSGSDVA